MSNARNAIHPFRAAGRRAAQVARIDAAISALILALPDCPRWASAAVDRLEQRRDALLEQHRDTLPEVWA